MEESAEYDALLRSVFDSCDTAGTGLINASEFEELCSQLSLENESGLLSAFLFESTSLISYEKFKDGLLMLLNGSLSGNNDSSSKSEVFCDDRYLEEDLNDNNVKNRHSEKFGSEDDSDVGFGDVDDEKSWIVIDLKESNNSKARDKRKYGRRSKPDLELLGSREMMDTSTNQDSVIHVTSCVEYYADGDGSDWITPDIGPTLETPTCDSQLDAEQALGAIWLEVIGDLERSIDVDELQKLYQALSLTSSCGDVEQLFELLDDDNDGFIRFNDFARQMAVFMTSQCENDDFREVEPATPRRRRNSNNSIGGDNLLTPEHKSTPLVASQYTSPNKCDVTPFHNNNTSGFMSSQSPEGFQDSSNGSMTSSITSPEQNYVGVPPYRRRHRNGNRHSRRRNNKIVSLPHYHPISRRRIEDSPLFFLTSGNGRYVEIEKLKKIWLDEGIEDSEEILENLGVNKDESFSVEVLGEALENELVEHPTHRAICALYKSGIRHYRSIQEQGSTESSRSRSVVENLNIQLQDQEERIERMEEEARRKMADLEEQFKTQLNELQLRLDQARHEINRQNESDGKQLRVEVDVLRRLKQTSREEIRSLGVENTRLKNRSRQVEARLQASEDKQVRMQHDFDIAYRGMALCNKSFDEQRHHMEVLLEQFKENSKKLQDENDELMTHLDAINRRWKPDEATSSRRYSTDYVSSSMTSSTTCTFDSGIPKPSLIVDDCDVSIDFTNSGFSGELPELSPIGKAPPNNFLNETKRPP